VVVIVVSLSASVVLASESYSLSDNAQLLFALLLRRAPKAQ
jgi:hypothetical protein